MARKAAKAKSRVKSKKKSRGKAKARKAKAVKKKAAKKAAARKTTAAPKKASPKKPPASAPSPAARVPKKPKPVAGAAVRTADAELRNRAGLVEVAAAAPTSAPLGDDEEKFLAVAERVDDFFAKEKKKIKPNEPLKDADKVSMFKLGDMGIDAVLTDFRSELHQNNPPFTLTLSVELRAKCKSADETIGDLKRDINMATTRAAAKPAPLDVAFTEVMAKPAELGDDEEKFLTVAESVDDFFVEAKKTAKPGEALKNADKLSIFKLGDEGIDAMLTDILATLAKNNPPFTLTLTAELREKSKSANETIGALKDHINRETTRS
jgi:hypothetical protein